MRPYLDAALRYWWAIAIVLALTWGTGAFQAYTEYATSFEADSTIWTDRQSQQFAALSSQDPGIGSMVTPAVEQAGVLSQLLQTRSFLQDVVDRASVARPAGTDEIAFFDEISKRFRVDVLGTNLFRLSYRARDSRTGAQMVKAALAEREERIADSRMAATSAAVTFYRSELDVAQVRVTDAERVLDTFDNAHKGTLTASEEYEQRQLRLAVEETKARVEDLKTRLDGSTVVPAMLQVADTLDFQVIDEPLDETRPSGGLRPAAAILGGAGLAGLALVAVILVGIALLAGGAVTQDDEPNADPTRGETPVMNLLPSPPGAATAGGLSMASAADSGRIVAHSEVLTN
jgi:hypothetical protein